MNTPTFEAAQNGLVGFLLVSMRVTGLVMLSPPFTSVPRLVRIALVLAFSAALFRAPAVVADIDLGALMILLAEEFVRGGLMAFGVIVGFAAFSLGARLIDVQVGFGLGQVLDPSTQRPAPVLSAAFTLLASVVFLATDGHHLMLRGFALGLERFPVAAPWPTDLIGQGVFHQVQGLFTLGLALVAPVVLCLVLVELGLGAMARNLPQMNVFVVGIPIKVLSALTALAVWALAMSTPMARVFESIFRAWEASFR